MAGVMPKLYGAASAGRTAWAECAGVAGAGRRRRERFGAHSTSGFAMLRGVPAEEAARMARKPSGKEAATVELADKLLRVLQSQRALGPEAYPLSVRRLAELTDPGAAPALLKKALNKRSFLEQAVRAHAKLPDAPIALA